MDFEMPPLGKKFLCSLSHCPEIISLRLTQAARLMAEAPEGGEEKRSAF